MHDDELNVPPMSPSFHEMVPVGIIIESDTSLTWTVKMSRALKTVVVVFKVIDVDVCCGKSAVEVAELPL